MHAILFDLDGTLIASEWLAIKSYRYGIQQVLQREISIAEQKQIIGKPISVFLANFPGKERELLVSISACYEQNIAKIQPYAGIIEVLNVLKSQGVPLGIVTSQSRKFALHVLYLTELLAYFSIVITAEDCKEHKPKPFPLLLASQQLKIDASQFLYIGDQLTDIQAAQAASMQSALALWGWETMPESAYVSSTFRLFVPQDILRLPYQLPKKMYYSRKTADERVEEH